MPKNSIPKIVTLSIFIILLIVSFFIVKPFISSILTALVLSYIFRPLHLKLEKLIKNKTISAFIVSILVFILLVAVSLIVLQITARQILDFYSYTQSTDIIAPLKAILVRIIDPTFSTQISFLLDTGLEKLTSFTINSISGLIVNLPIIIIQLIVTFFVMFYFIKDGDLIIDYLKSILPFKEETRDKFFNRFSEITSGVIYGTITVGIIQGICAGIGFYLFGVEGAFLLTLMATLLSILPIGPWVIWLPVGISLIIKGNINEGIGLILFGLIIVSYIDNIIRPYFVGRKAKQTHAISLIGMLGGFSLFGFIGLIVGPIILDYLIIFLEIYRTGHLKDMLKKED
ncbi:MAG: AI-2E family transporter [Candidatus Pacearchaeota archaeon]